MMKDRNRTTQFPCVCSHKLR